MKVYMKVMMVFLLIFAACKNDKTATKADAVKKEVIAYASFGEKIDAKNVISIKEMSDKFNNLKSGDTINVKFKSTVKEVCQKKGCWMKVDLGNDKETMVRFKDYGFFMPFNSKGQETILNGKAFVTTISVKELQHYAKDAGKTPEEIAKITEPKVTLAFEADGVLMEVKDDAK